MTLFAALVANLLPGCTAMILEAEYITPFQVKEFSDASHREIHLSGAINHSALGVYKVVTVQENRSLQVLVYLKLEHPGNLDYTLRIPDDIDTVTFGEKKKVIWIRDNALPHPNVQ